MAAAAAAPAQVFATRKEIEDLTHDYHLASQEIEEGHDFDSIDKYVSDKLAYMDKRSTPDLREFVKYHKRIVRDTYESARKWNDIVGMSSFFEAQSPPSGIPDAAYHPTNIPIETYNKWKAHKVKLNRLNVDTWRVIDDKLDRIGWALQDDGESPPGAEGRGMPQHMQRGDMWQEGVNRRR